MSAVALAVRMNAARAGPPAKRNPRENSMAKHGMYSRNSQPLPGPIPTGQLAVRASPMRVAGEPSGSDNYARPILRAVWRGLAPVAAILGGAQAIALAAGTSGGQPAKLLVLVALMAAAAKRPGSAFYSVMLGNSLYLLLGELTVVPALNFLGPGILLAGLIGSSRKGIISVHKKPPFVATGLFVGWVMLVSMVAGAPPPFFWYSTALLLAAGLGFQLLARDRLSQLAAWGAVVVGAALLGGYSVFTYLRAGEMTVHGLAREESVADPNYLAVMIAVGCVPAMVLAREMITGRKQVWGIIVASLGGLCLFSVVFLASRGVLLAVGVALIVTMLLLVRRRGFKFAVAIGVAAVLLLAGLSRLAEYQGGTLEVFQRFVTRGQADPTGERLGLAQASLTAMVARGPYELLAGTGPYSNFTAVGRVWGTGGAHTHNAVLEYALDFGLIGAGLFLALFWVAFKSAQQAGANIKLIKIGQLVLIAIAGLSINPLADFTIVVVLGLSVAYCRNDPVPLPHLNRSRPSRRAEGPARMHAAGEGGPVG